MTWDNGTQSGEFTYDDLGRKLTETVNYGTFSLSHAYTYTASGMIASFTGPDGTTISYDYDNGGRLAGITLPGAGQAGFSYDGSAWNSPIAATLPGGTRRDFTYDPLMRADTITASDPGGNPVMTRGYTYNTAGSIITKATEHGDYTYSYDTMDRLTSAVNPTLPDESYSYDSLDNRITDDKVTGPITYNADNQLESYGTTSYDYDNNGNLTGKTSGTYVTSFFYNIEDRLEKVENSTGDTVATYGYDPFGRRLWKETSGTRTYFHYSNQGLVGEYNAQGEEIKAYGYKPGTHWTTDPLFMRMGTDYYWYQNDANGTPQKLIASNGLVVYEGRYDSFGNCEVVNSGVTNHLRFAGQYFDQETGLHYNLQRYYDPQTGRYLRIDPLGDGLNLYAYCFNNPNGWIDPLGLCAINNYFNALMESWKERPLSVRILEALYDPDRNEWLMNSIHDYYEKRDTFRRMSEYGQWYVDQSDLEDLPSVFAMTPVPLVAAPLIAYGSPIVSSLYTNAMVTAGPMAFGPLTNQKTIDFASAIVPGTPPAPNIYGYLGNELGEILGFPGGDDNE